MKYIIFNNFVNNNVASTTRLIVHQQFSSISTFKGPPEFHNSLH